MNNSEKDIENKFGLPFRLRKSIMIGYKYCPRQILYSEIKGIPRVPSDRMVDGTNVHKSIDEFYPKLDLKEMLEVENLKTYFLEKITWDDRTLRFILNFIELEAIRFNLLQTKEEFFPLYSEQKFQNDKEWFEGTPDLIFGVNGHTQLWEIKAGKKRQASDMRRELCFYKVLLNGAEHFPRTVDRIGAYYLGAEGEDRIFYEEPKPRSETAFWKTVNEVREGIAANKWPCKLSFRCGDCNYVGLCFG